MAKYYFNGQLYDSEYLAHYGRKGMKWGKNIFLTPYASSNRRRGRRGVLLRDSNGLSERESRDIGRIQQRGRGYSPRNTRDYIDIDTGTRTTIERNSYRDYSDSELRFLNNLYAQDLTEERDRQWLDAVSNSGLAYVPHINARATVSAINRELESRKLVNKVKNWASNLVKTTTSTIKNSSAYKTGASIFSALFSNKPIIETRKTITIGNNIPSSKPLFGATAAVSAQQALKKTQKITNRTGRR